MVAALERREPLLATRLEFKPNTTQQLPVPQVLVDVVSFYTQGIKNKDVWKYCLNMMESKFGGAVGDI